MDYPTFVDALLGRHGYGESPEIETAWCRRCLVLGILFGVLITIFLK